jgi:MraZ protein
VELDAAGRIMVPGFLGEHAKLSKEIVVVGAGDRLELWNRTSWDEHRPALLGSVGEITARVDHPA